LTTKERILITVKTYPTISKTHGELVCTAGFREDGSWVRLYPVPFRRMEEYNRFAKYQWMSVRLNARTKDRRPESFSPVLDSIELHEKISTGKSREWAGRKDLILKKGKVYDDLAALIELNKANELSLATFKPTDILEVTAKPVERDWGIKQVAAMDALHRQGDLFAEDTQFKEQFKLVQKLPYAFSYRYRDCKGKESHTMIEDWEVGALYWNCIKRGDSEEKAVQMVKDKFHSFWEKTDLHLFLGTTLKYDAWSHNPFLIIGTFTPPNSSQGELDLFG
jgi:hypothetical protein